VKFYLPARPIHHLICNAAVYRPTDPEPAFTDDGYEMSMGVNHLGHFLLVNLLLPDLKKAKNSRVCIVGSITGNSNTIGGGFVYPRAEIGELEGLKQGPNAEMVDGGSFDGAKAYKDAKALNMMTVTELHRRFHDETGITFSSMYPGCIAETALFREKRDWFRKIFPLFMKYVTGGYVSEVEAGDGWRRSSTTPSAPSRVSTGRGTATRSRSASQTACRTRRRASGRCRCRVLASGGEIFENEFSGMIKDERRARLAWDYSMDLVKDFM